MRREVDRRAPGSSPGPWCIFERDEMNLTLENYHSKEANLEFMSNSQYSGFLQCPSKEVAKQSGAYQEGPKACFETGGYIDINLLTPELYPEWFDRHRAALVETGCLSKRDNAKKNAALVQADAMIARAAVDPVFMSYLKGDAQKIYTFEFAGVIWRAALDVFNSDLKRLVDLKSTKSITDLSWCDWWTIYDKIEENTPFGKKVPFYEAFSYYRQLALYRYAVEYNEGFVPDCFIAAISKEAEPDIEVLQFDDDDRFAQELGQISLNMPDIVAWKSGETVAPRCERCEYCRSTKKLTGPVAAKSWR